MPVLEAQTIEQESNLGIIEPSEITFEPQMNMLSEIELPAEDGIPTETNWHRSAMNLLIDSVHALWHHRNDYFAGGNK